MAPSSSEGRPVSSAWKIRPRWVILRRRSAAFPVSSGSSRGSGKATSSLTSSGDGIGESMSHLRDTSEDFAAQIRLPGGQRLLQVGNDVLAKRGKSDQRFDAKFEPRGLGRRFAVQNGEKRRRVSSPRRTTASSRPVRGESR